MCVRTPDVEFNLTAMAGLHVALIFSAEISDENLYKVADLVKHAFEVNVVGIDPKNHVVYYRHENHIGQLIAKVIFHGLMRDLPLLKIIWDENPYNGPSS